MELTIEDALKQVRDTLKKVQVDGDYWEIMTNCTKALDRVITAVSQKKEGGADAGGNAAVQQRDA